MLRSLSTKFFFAILAALLFVIALIGILYKYVEQRDRMRMHAAAETGGVGSRAGYYEEAGALRDMVANHLLQLLTLTAMEPPVAFDADSVREEKVQVLRSIRRLKPDQVARRTVRAQGLQRRTGRQAGVSD